MSHSGTILRSRASVPSRARGAVLFIALIVLVAMTLAGIAIMRSVDTATLIAGNLAFKQGTVQSSDNGIEVAYQWLLANRTTLSNSNAGQGYNSGVASPIWTNPATWAGAVTVGTDVAGNTISYLINRMCNIPDLIYSASQSAVRAGQPGRSGGAASAGRRRKLHGRRAGLSAGPEGLLPHHRAQPGPAQFRELHTGNGCNRAVRRTEYPWRAS